MAPTSFYSDFLVSPYFLATGPSQTARPQSRLLIITFHIFLVALTLAAIPARLRNELKGSSIIGVIIRDGTWAFVLLFGEFQV